MELTVTVKDKMLQKLSLKLESALVELGETKELLRISEEHSSFLQLENQKLRIKNLRLRHPLKRSAMQVMRTAKKFITRKEEMNVEQVREDLENSIAEMQAELNSLNESKNDEV